jgi:hypothetical protein
MKNILLCCAAVLLLTGVCWGAPQTSAQPSSGGPLQKYVVVHSIRFLASVESLTNAQANCTIQTASGAASMQCHPTGVTQKDDYHYVAALIVDSQGTGYVVACRDSLVAFWCKGFAARTVILGNMVKSNLAVSDGDKVHNYVVLTSAYVGLSAVGLQTQSATTPPAAAAPPVAAVAPAPASASAAPAPTPTTAAAPPATANRSKSAVEAPADASAACASATGACVSFISEPPGADIYVDDKFVGNTPSVITLSAGSHEIRMEDANRKPWTRKLETSAGSKITLRGTFEVPASDK